MEQPPVAMRLDPPHRLDLDLRAWLAAVAALRARDEPAARTRAEQALEAALPGACADIALPLAFLSARSAFDALLSCSGLVPGDEVLFTALTIDDMPRIAAAHGLRPVALDIDRATLLPLPGELERCAGPRTRMIVVAELFGGRLEAAPLRALAAARGWLYVTDMAQGFGAERITGATDATDAVGRPAWPAAPLAVGDITLLSFGTLKTSTALGGALALVADPALRARLAAVQAAWPRQRAHAYAGKLAKALAMLALQRVTVYSLLGAAARACGATIGDAVRALTRGFGRGDDEALLRGLRRRPAPALLTALASRLRHLDDGRLARRAAAAEAVAAALPAAILVGAAQRQRSHWLLPISVDDPVGLRRRLLAAGFDASSASNVVAVGGDESRALVAGMVLLPAYPELPPQRRRRLIEVVRAHVATCAAARPSAQKAAADATSAESPASVCPPSLS